MDERLRVLIVDDEVFPRRTLMNHVPWDSLGMDAFEAQDGQKALERMASLRPEILITDIRMPRMDGLALAEKTRAWFPETKIVFLSAYADAVYLKSAISLQVASFLEKPIDIAAVTRLLASLRDEIDAELRSLSSQKETLALALAFEPGPESSALALSLFPSFQGALYATLIARGPSYGVDIGKKICDAFQWPLLAALKGEQGVMHIACPTQDDLARIGPLAAQAALSSAGPDVGDAAAFCIAEREARPLASRIDLRFALGEAVTSPGELWRSCRSAQERMQRAYLAGSSMLCLAALKKDQGRLEAEAEAFREALDRGSRPEAALALRRYAQSMRLYCSASEAKSLLAACLKEITRRRDDAAPYGDEAANEAARDIYEYRDIDAALDALELALMELAQARTRAAEGSDNFARIEKYLREEYSKPMFSLTSLCGDLDLSTSYVCRLYKEKKGATIHAVIEELRLEKAKLLLRHSCEKLGKIAAQCGYADPKYFAKVFKKATGVGPLHYRSRGL